MPNTEATDSADACRGSALTEYALILALVLVATIGGVQFLSTSGTTLLNEVGDDIAAPRPYRNILTEAPVSPPPPWVPLTPPSTILTWVDKPARTPAGCLSVAATNITIGPCTLPTIARLNGLSADGELIQIALTDGSGCLSGDGATEAVTMQPCGGAGQDWRELSKSGSSVNYQHEASGLCLDPDAAPAALTLVDCGESSGQLLEVLP